MSKPVWIQVLWSESRLFKDNDLLPFVDFEIRAHKAAIKVGYDKGYDKTKINVLFDDGNSYQCRLDLAPHDTHGFEHHAEKFIRWYERQEDDSPMQDAYAGNYNFLKQVVWPEVEAKSIAA